MASIREGKEIGEFITVYQHTRVPFTLCIIIEYILDYKLVAVDR
jgi:hypothetical protein